MKERLLEALVDRMQLMKNQIRDYVNYARELIAQLIMPRAPKKALNSSEYWESRYIQGGDSGLGSFGLLAVNKSKFMMEIVTSHEIKSVIDLGCGDGNQLEHFDFCNVDYFGYDVSQFIIDKVREKYHESYNYKFSSDFSEIVEFNSRMSTPSMVISFDVLYHLVQDATYYDYLRKIEILNPDFILIYSTNFDQGSDKYHVRHRKFTRDFSSCFPEYSLLSLIHSPVHPDTSADFYLFGKNQISGASVLSS